MPRHAPHRDKESSPESKAHHRLESDLPNLKTRSYYVKHISKSIEKHAVSFLSRLTSEQQAYMRRELVTHQRAIHSKQELLLFTYKWIKLFDRAFFYGAIESKLWRVRVFTKDDADGRTLEGCYKGWDRSLNINLDPGFQHRGAMRATTLEYATTVVHEMLHAFLHIYSCSCVFCRKRRKRGAVNGNEGNSGHGPLFLNSLRAIEVVMMEEYGRGFETGLYEALKTEMEQTGWQPRRDQFQRWGLIYFEVEQGQVWEGESGDEGTENENRSGMDRYNVHRNGEESNDPWDGAVLCCDVM